MYRVGKINKHQALNLNTIILNKCDMKVSSNKNSFVEEAFQQYKVLKGPRIHKIGVFVCVCVVDYYLKINRSDIICMFSYIK